MKISTLNILFGIFGQLKFESIDDNLVSVKISNQYANAELSLQGGNLLSWEPKNEENMIWLSQEAIFSEGQSIRGGVPICWPWFGAHPMNTTFPAHGYVRTLDWEVNRTKALSNGNTFIALQPLLEKVPHKYYKSNMALELQITVGKRLEMVLITRNSGKSMITLGGALHTYFNVSDIENVTIFGLENQPFIDALDNWQQKNEVFPIMINAEIDRIYQDTPENDVVIVDRGYKRKIRISKQGSHSTVVWNPWIDKSIRLGDMGKDGYRKMVCVETTNAAADVITIEPDGEHRLSVCYTVESLQDD